MPRVVLDARAEAYLLHHLEVVERALLETLLLEEATLCVEECEPLAKFLADALDRRAHLRLRRDVVRAWIDGIPLNRSPHAPAQRIDLPDRLDDVAEELDANRHLLLVGWKDLDDVTAHAKRPAMKVDVVALVLDVDQPTQQDVAPHLFADREVHDEAMSSSPHFRCRRCSSRSPQ